MLPKNQIRNILIEVFGRDKVALSKELRHHNYEKRRYPVHCRIKADTDEVEIDFYTDKLDPKDYKIALEWLIDAGFYVWENANMARQSVPGKLWKDWKPVVHRFRPERAEITVSSKQPRFKTTEDFAL